jgi:peptide/nickel transport system permease protein
MTMIEGVEQLTPERGGAGATLRSVLRKILHPSPVVRRYLTNPLSMAGTVLVILFAIIAVGAPIIAPPEKGARDPYQIPRDGYRAEPEPPSANHIWGTTEGQYDIFYGVVWGTRTAFQVGLIITLSTVAVGLIVGTISSYYGGWVDEAMMRITEVFMAFPFLMAAITMAAVLQPRLGKSLLTGMIALITFGWTTYARLIRGDILTVKERDYVMAARVLGANDARIMLRHVIPNAIFPTLVVGSMDIGSYVISFAALSFLGVGAEVGYADWGQMISFARNWIPSLAQYWYILVYPGFAILLFCLGWNLIGDAFRDILDPKLRRVRQ